MRFVPSPVSATSRTGLRDRGSATFPAQAPQSQREHSPGCCLKCFYFLPSSPFFFPKCLRAESIYSRKKGKENKVTCEAGGSGSVPHPGAHDS